MRTLRLVAVVLLGLVLVAGAQAHASYASSEPAAGARLGAAPTEIRVRFTEPVDAAGASLDLRDANGDVWLLGPLRLEGDRTVRAAVADPLPDNAYRVIWQTLSETDGHVEKGAFSFAIGEAEPIAAGDEAMDAAWGTAGARALLYAGLALAFGAFAFWAYVLPRDARVVKFLVLGTALHVAGVAWLLAETRALTGLDYGTFFGSTVGALLRERLAAGVLALLAAGLAFVWPRGRAAGVFAAIAMLAWAAVDASRLSHAAGEGLAGALLDLIHLVAAATWIGSLLLFASTLRREPPDARALGRRFGTVALLCVTSLLAAGVLAQAFILGLQLWTPGAVLATMWGKALLAKILLTWVMIGLAGLNRFVLLADPAPRKFAARMRDLGVRVTGGRLRAGATRPLRRMVAVEAAIGLAVLGIAGVLTSVSPPAEAAALEQDVTAEGTTYTMDGAWIPPPKSAFSSTLEFTLTDSTGAALAQNECGRASCVTLVLESRAEHHAGHPSAAERYDAYPGGGAWLVRDILWVHPGPMRATLLVQSAAVYQDTMSFDFDVAL